MKGKVSVRYTMPSFSRFRGRIENPSKDFTSQMREELSNVICDVLNESTLKIRSKFIDRVSKMELNFKTPQHEAKVMSLLENFFDIFFAPTPESLDALFGEEVEESTDESEESEQEGINPETQDASDSEDFD